MQTVYYITVTTDDSYTVDEYDPIARVLLEGLAEIFDDPLELSPLLANEATSAKIEAEISRLDSIEESPIVARLVVQLEGEKTVSVNKPRLTAAVRSKLPFSVKVQKRNASSD